MCDPVSATIAAATAVTANQANKSRKSAEGAAREQQRLMQEAESQRMREAQAEAERIREAEQRRQQNITQGQSEIAGAFGQFNDDFYGQRAQAYQNFATPQLERQYQDQMKQLTAALARSGNLNSSLRGDLMGQLQRQFDQGKLTIADTSRGYADQAKSSVEQARARLMESNMSLADPGVIRNSATAEAQGLMANPQFANLGQLLSNLSANVGSANTRTTQPAMTGGVQLFSPGLKSATGRLVN
jgi:predicted RNA-binding Zn ribbon-like protein